MCRRLYAGGRIRVHLPAVRDELRPGDRCAGGPRQRSGRTREQRRNTRISSGPFAAARAITSACCSKSSTGCTRSDRLWGFGFKWPLTTASEAEAATHALATWQAHFTGSGVPPNLGHQAMLVYTKDAGDKDLAPYFVVRGVFNGSEADCRDGARAALRVAGCGASSRHLAAGQVSRAERVPADFPTEMPGNVPASARSLAKSHIVERHLTAAQWAPVVDLYRSRQTATVSSDWKPTAAPSIASHLMPWRTGIGVRCWM